jgi:DNA topoisomerase-1
VKLVIIEGVGKKDTIKKYLGAGYVVEATGGHFRDLGERTLSVDVEDGYKPKYVIATAKKDLVKRLKEKAQSCETVYIATDPDREGEAIAYHLCFALGIKPEEAKRIEFNEITKTAINKAIECPRPINIAKFNSQQARRILDRLVGYRLSPVVSKKIKPKLSAGRVQSVTLKLVVIREREIQGFKPEEFWDFGARLEKNKIDFLANIITDKGGKKLKITSKAQAEGIIDELGLGSTLKYATKGEKADDTALAGTAKSTPTAAKFIVTDIRKSVTKRHAPAPYTTSTMQQDALNKAGLSLKRCGMAAQELYQGVKLGEHGMVALVTYIRTDSVRVSPEAQGMAKQTIIDRFGKDFAPENFNFYKSKKSAQDAHEAIRPTHLEITPDGADKYLSPEQSKLYRLIYNRFLASQMAEAVYNSVSVDIGAAGYGFRVTGRTPVFAGWTAVYFGVGGKKKLAKDDTNEDDDDGEDKVLPEMTVGEEVKFLQLEFAQKFTKPPARYTEATLVKAMEEAGIGRPATYNPIIQNIAARFYTERDGKAIKPTELGFLVVDLLDKYFIDIMDIKFTADMEDKLDDIAVEGLDWVKVIDDFYKPFEKKISVALDGSDEAFKYALEVSDTPCSKCGKMMVVRTGRFGKFLACPGFPECRNILPFDKPVGKCPKCGKDIYKRKSKRGRIFYGCSGYPDCDYVSWDAPKEEENK